MKSLLIIPLIFLLGCAAYGERGHFELVDGKYKKVPDDYQLVTGQGSEVKWSKDEGIKSGKIIPDIGVPKELEIKK